MKVFLRYLVFYFLLVFVNAPMVKGQESQEQDKLIYNLSSPLQSITTHLKYLQEGLYYPEISAKAFYPKYASAENAKQLAIKLKQVLDGKGIYLEMDQIPADVNYQDSTTKKNRYYVTEKYPGLYLEKITGRWYYSKKTVESINQWHKEVYPYGTDRLLKLLPKSGNKKYLGLFLWQLVGIFFLVLLCFVIFKAFNLIFEKVIINILYRFGKKRLASDLVVPVAKPVSYLVIFLLLTLLVPVLQLSVTVNKYIMLFLNATWPIFATIFFYRLIDIISIYFAKLADKTESSLDDQLVPLARKVLKTFVVIIGLLFIFNNLEFDITGLIAGLSIGGLAFALAAQDTIKNFFGSLMIFVDKPFQVGDWITSGDVDGTVEEVGFRSTRVRTFRNSVTYIPNGVITDRMVDNHGLRVYRRFYTQIAVTYDTPASLVEVFVEGLKEIVTRHPQTRKDYFEVHLNDMAASSLNVMFYIFFKVPSWSEELKARHEILLSIMRLAEELGVNFAFPTQTLHMETFPEKAGNSPSYMKDMTEMRHKLNGFFEKNNP